MSFGSQRDCRLRLTPRQLQLHRRRHCPLGQRECNAATRTKRVIGILDVCVCFAVYYCCWISLNTPAAAVGLRAEVCARGGGGIVHTLTTAAISHTTTGNGFPPPPKTWGLGFSLILQWVFRWWWCRLTISPWYQRHYTVDSLIWQVNNLSITTTACICQTSTTKNNLVFIPQYSDSLV